MAKFLLMAQWRDGCENLTYIGESARGGAAMIGRGREEGAATAAALIEVTVNNTSLCAAGTQFSQFKMNPAPNKMLNQIY